MKPVCLFILFALAASAAPAQEPEQVHVSLVLDGRTVPLTAAEESTFTAMALEGLQSSSYEADTSVATLARWTTAARGSRLQLTFGSPRTVDIRFGSPGVSQSRSLPLQELLLPVSGARPPDYILIRSQGRVRAFANFGPLVARLEQALTRLPR